MKTPPPDAPLVLLHAFPLNAAMWDEIANAFPRRTVIAPNFPGFGGEPADAATLDEFADHVLATMDVAGLREAVLVGLSMGGYVCFRIWQRSPERVRGMILADTRAGADDEAARAKRSEQAERARAEGVDWLPDAMIPNLLGESTRTSQPEVVEEVRRMIVQATPDGVAAALLAMRDRPDSRSLLQQIDVPVLAIVGEEDGLTPPDQARLISEGVRHGTLEVIARAGHLSALENPGAFEQAMKGFLGES